MVLFEAIGTGLHRGSARHVEALRRNRSLPAALSAVTAAVVGVVLNLAVRFTLHTVFKALAQHSLGPFWLELPVWSSIEPGAAILAVATMVAMLRFRLGLGWTLLGSSLIGAAYWWARNTP